MTLNIFWDHWLDGYIRYPLGKQISSYTVGGVSDFYHKCLHSVFRVCVARGQKAAANLFLARLGSDSL